ncbi:M48 family metalloprotease [Flavobacterium sp.]|uniref:M48 family metalloprotease n=1 Tax=Flavobacterium sp. TaxID=239 RepID=UPI0039E4A5EB
MTTVKPSKEFTAKAYQAVLAIVLFILVYLSLLLLAFGMLAACGYFAFKIIAIKPSFITLILGVGLFAVGVFIVVFMLKFLFKKNRADYSNLTEIDTEQEPELHQMITDLVEQTQTKFPKRVYVSPEVNASVFYESSFWSMFLPVRKNLHIGLGLVNTTTVSELKGILAHEFGHFSQRLMKVGSYVYNVNKVIHDILYDNAEYEQSMYQWANHSGYFALFTQIAVGFNKGVQGILRMMYNFVNVKHLALSRQMEFHADAIATHIVGSEPMIRSMRRMNLASESYDQVIAFYNNNFSEAYTTHNIFPQQTAALHFIASNNKIPLVDGLPEVTPDFSERFNKSKLVFGNQWNSHPSEDERIAAYQQLNVSTQNPDNRPANVLFRNLEALQKRVTGKLFVGVAYPKERFIADVDAFSAYLIEDHQANKLPDLFNSYYANYNPPKFDLEAQIQKSTEVPALDSLFNNDKIEMIFVFKAMENDAETLRMIANGSYDIKTFDYDGTRYKASDAQLVYEKLLRQIELNREAILANDDAIFSYFYHRAKMANQEQRLMERYKDFFRAEDQYNPRLELYQQMIHDFSFAYETLQSETILLKMRNFKQTEATFKAEFQNLLSDPFYSETITDDAIRKTCEKYIDDPSIYFFKDQYNSEAIELKNQAVHYFILILGRTYFLKKKALLDFEASIG